MSHSIQFKKKKLHKMWGFGPFKHDFLVIDILPHENGSYSYFYNEDIIA